ncbi:S-adenosyl-L-methionine-dependent methyltransferase [Ilyonectria robusta]|uniref:S-adenosyl-L-methionine-dependent methyltransferase n=1 Tax=Ilyonectria robusta TaxID=1079257 RepID=UPI001E8D6E45|nr:S-adenosyl-L-methionine-dependent methyltransferase [Ilyonectria robusta]KAH8694848.1 S-adenosyl-L-methionine-dependent methyltransferase [Ilyonectria robusta]
MSLHNDSEGSDEGEWLDMEPEEEETVAITSFFDAQTFPTVVAMLDHCKKDHAFDFAACLKRLSLDFHGAVKLVNYVRDHVKQGLSLPAEISLGDFEDERYLRPVLENDALIFSLDEILETIQGSGADMETKDASVDSLSARNRELEEELEKVRGQFANYRLAVEQTLDRRWGDEADAVPAQKKDDSAYYFESYAAHEIHETMLKDVVRTDAYRDFIYGNKHIFKDKVVLDIGCGTGILSMFCAKAGAKQVIAVDKSDIITKARENVFNNGLSNVITLLRGAIEDVQLPVDKVDIIVSEWMGYCLLYEAMLPSVLYARDKYLKPDGLLAPSSATIWIAPVADSEYVSDHISYWRDVYGFDMKSMQEGIYNEARVEAMPESSVCGEAFPFKVLDLHTIKTSDLQFTAKWSSKLTRKVDSVDGFLIWFDNFFATSRSEPVPAPETTPTTWDKTAQGGVAFTTGPYGTVTHWKQGLLIAPQEESPAGTTSPASLSGEITFEAPEDNARALTLKTSWTDPEGHTRTESWQLK